MKQRVTSGCVGVAGPSYSSRSLNCGIKQPLWPSRLPKRSAKSRQLQTNARAFRLRELPASGPAAYAVPSMRFHRA